MAKILVAEDDHDVRELVVFTLRFAGYVVLGVNSGDEVVNQAKIFHPDLILLDVRMPKMNGYEACRVLKADSETSSIPVVFLTVRGEESEVQTGLDAGAADYILKPIAPDQLTTRVKYYLSKASE